MTPPTLTGVASADPLQAPSANAQASTAPVHFLFMIFSLVMRVQLIKHGSDEIVISLPHYQGCKTHATIISICFINYLLYFVMDFIRYLQSIPTLRSPRDQAARRETPASRSNHGIDS